MLHREDSSSVPDSSSDDQNRKVMGAQCIEIPHYIEDGREQFWKQLKTVTVMNDDFVDNEMVAEVPIYIGRGGGLELTPEIMPIELLCRGSQLGLSVDKYQEIIKIVTNTPFESLRKHNERLIVYVMFCVASAVQIVCLCLWLLASGLVYFIKQDTDSGQKLSNEHEIEPDPITDLCYMMLFCFVIVLHMFFYSFDEHHYLQEYASLLKKLAKANRIAMEHNLMVTVKQYGYFQMKNDLFTIVFTYFNWWPCLDYLQRSVFDFNKRLPLKYPKEILLKYGTCYAMLLLKGQTQSLVKRHCSMGQCVCQCIESRLPISWAMKILRSHIPPEFQFLGERFFRRDNWGRLRSIPFFLQSSHKHYTSKILIVISAVYIALTFFLYLHFVNGIMLMIAHQYRNQIMI